MTTPAPLDPKHDPNRTEGRFSGIHPDNTYPLVDGKIDEEQERRLQARQEHDWAEGRRPDHPPFTERFTSNDHASRRADNDVPVYDTPAPAPAPDVVA